MFAQTMCIFSSLEEPLKAALCVFILKKLGQIFDQAHSYNISLVSETVQIDQVCFSVTSTILSFEHCKPSKLFREHLLILSIRMPLSNSKCPFCMEQIREDSFVLHTSTLFQHVACMNCIKTWLIYLFSQFLPNQSPVCPLCREVFDELLCDKEFLLSSICREFVPKICNNKQLSI